MQQPPPTTARLLAAVLVLVSPLALCAAESTWSVTDPANHQKLEVALSDGRLSYAVSDAASGAAIVAPSPIGIQRTDTDWNTGIVFVSATEPHKLSDSYTLITAKRHEVHTEASERVLTFANASGAHLTVTLRAYPHGVAFRYGFPGAGSRVLFLSGDSTGLHLPKGSRFWAQPYSPVSVWAPGYESDYVNGVPADTQAPGKTGWALPLLYSTGTHWALLTESGVGPEHFGVHLNSPTSDGLFTARLPEEDETYGVAPQTAAIRTPWESPWRAILIGKTAGDIAINSLVTDLAPPATLTDTSWIKPGVSSWSWWSDHKSPYDYNALTKYVDLSARMKWPYTLIDLGWQEMKNGSIEKLVDYAKGKGVGVLLWYNSGGRHNQVPGAGPNDLLVDPIRRDAEFARMAAMGAKGIKVDFFQSDKQYVIGLYHDILRDAARHKLLVNFHGCTYPKGWERTYPHLLAMEAVSGAEQYWSKDFAKAAPRFHTIYPFTRNAIGPMDYTPTTLLPPDVELPGHVPHVTTNAHELALLVVFASGIQHVIDQAENFAAQPAGVHEALEAIPTVWDESRCLVGEPGSAAVFARRAGDTWYVGGINGEDAPRSLKISLDFLGKHAHHGLLLTDGARQQDVVEQRRTFESKDSLDLALAARGGFLLKLTR